VEEAEPKDIVFLRDQKGVAHRWQKAILRGMNKFIPHWRNAYTPLKSGWNDEDYFNYAMLLFQQEQGEIFKFGHCALILKEVPEFDPNISAEEVQELAIDKDVANDVGGAIQGSKMKKKPIGTKKAKEAEAKAKELKDSATVKSTQFSELVESQKRMAIYQGRVAFAIEKSKEIDEIVQLATLAAKWGDMEQARSRCTLARSRGTS
jgi:hypothetical protein